MNSYDAAMFRIDLTLAEYNTGYAAGWAAGRADLMRQLAQRVDCLDATWRPIERPTWEQQVAARIAEMRADAARFRQQHGIAAQDWQPRTQTQGVA